MRLLRQIERHKYKARMITSVFAFAELGQSARDARVAVKIIRDGLSLNWFNRLKKHYSLTTRERGDILESISSFHEYLERLGVEIVESMVNDRDLNRIALRYSIEVPDATHVLIAKNEKADYIVTIDPDFLRSNLKTPKVVLPTTLETITALRN